MEKKKEEMENIKKELDEKTKRIDKLRQSKVEIKNKLEEYQRDVVDNERKAAHWLQQRSNLSLHNYKYAIFYA